MTFTYQIKKKIDTFLAKRKKNMKKQQSALTRAISESQLHKTSNKNKVTELNQYSFKNEEFNQIKNKFKDFYVIRNTFEDKDMKLAATYKKEDECKKLVDKYPQHQKISDNWDSYFKEQENFEKMKQEKLENEIQIHSQQNIKNYSSAASLTNIVIPKEGSLKTQEIRLKQQGSLSVLGAQDLSPQKPKEDNFNSMFDISLNNIQENVPEVTDEHCKHQGAYMQSLFEKKETFKKRKNYLSRGDKKTEFKDKCFKVDDNGKLSYFDNKKYYKKQKAQVLGPDIKIRDQPYR